MGSKWATRQRTNRTKQNKTKTEKERNPAPPPPPTLHHPFCAGCSHPFSVSPPVLKQTKQQRPHTPSIAFRHLAPNAIGSRKLSANEQCFCWCSNSSKFVTNNSDYIGRLFRLYRTFVYNWPCRLRQLKSNENRLNRDGTSFFYPGWMRLMFTCVLGC